LDSAQNLILSEILNSNLSNPRIELIYYLPRITIFLWILIFINLGISGILLWMGTTDLHIRIISLFLFLPQIFSLFSLWGRINLLEVGLEIALPGLIGFFIHSIWKMVTNFFYKTSATIF
jgi:tryptophan-rich sensory protein